MLDAIADFWKPVKKAPAAAKMKPEELQLGSAVGFGFVPQTTLSGRRLTVTAINSYRFGEDTLTSFVMSQEKDAGASMIVATADGEQYLAISRRISITDRSKLFNQEDLDAVIENVDAVGLACKDGVTDYKGWTVAHYKREIHGMKGLLFKGDYRKTPLPPNSEALPFAYTLLVSESNEHALEIEKYDDGRVEVYATVYRRIGDIGEVSHPAPKENARADIKLDSAQDNKPKTVSAVAAPSLSSSAVVSAPSKPEPKLEAPKPDVQAEVKPEAPKVEAKPEEPKIEAKPEPVVLDVQAETKAEPIKLPEFAAEDVAKKEVETPVKPELVVSHEKEAKASELTAPAAITIQSRNQPYFKQEIKAVNNEASNFVNESIDCDLLVANKIIDEAIRNEMRINDVVRRVIGLPVSQQESVQIPVTLTDQDYSLLAIRYGIGAADREAIKKRIIEDLGDFSGLNKQKKAA